MDIGNIFAIYFVVWVISTFIGSALMLLGILSFEIMAWLLLGAIPPLGFLGFGLIKLTFID